MTCGRPPEPPSAHMIASHPMTTADRPARHGPKDPQDFYFAGATPFFASRYDQRLSYALYVPQASPPGGGPRPLVVVQHGTGRTAAAYRDAFAGFAERHGATVLAPLFPAGIHAPGDLHAFKFLRAGGLRYDLALLDIVAEVGERFDVRTERFWLHGFSGGGQFTHRFGYLHPDRLAGISIGAPGRVTLIDRDRPWWLGLGGAEQELGDAPRPELLAGVPVQMVVGAEDVETWEITNPGHSNWMPGQEEYGATRIERLRTLRDNFEAHGIAVRFDLVEGVAHDGMGVLGAVWDFFGPLLAAADRGAGR
ncbi:PHB depolymerase family esterase [Allonocardiopsis opalescens]|uniref:Esterase/PHB depolymerase n=1 Tax=Allonocardiopsis opalescens TaxID=1144618 RepID=A0A2T0QEF9_9ACTN|nr:PHB depolymerase family esterase [Allonocardiopsis opalescens]PRY02317.1 esterase/PHB depolymerase [Allonocardiopsis opalescens]